VEIWFAPYVLRSRGSLNATAKSPERVGALLRIETEEGTGFADLHPWPELGDLPLEKQLELLAGGEFTPLTTQSVFLASLDRDARRLGKNVFERLSIPPSHFLIHDGAFLDARALEEARVAGFRSLKIKLGRCLSSEIEALKKHAGILTSFRLRLDFNASLEANCVEWLNSLPRDVVSSIEFLEDPVPWNPKVWKELREKVNVPLALDCMKEAEAIEEVAGAFDYLVLKPAIQEEAFVRTAEAKGWRLVVTSYMDHPVGQVGAALVAARIGASKEHSLLGECGLLTHTCFEPNAYSEALQVAGARLLPPEGTGIGFDELLERETWKKLK